MDSAWLAAPHPIGGLPLPARPSLDVVLPTIDGRQRYLYRCLDAYRSTLGAAGYVEDKDWRFRVGFNYPTCGAWWDEATGMSKADVVHFTADDLVPKPGWWPSALEAIRVGVMPAPVISNFETGILEFGGSWATLLPEWARVPMTVIPTFPRAAWEAGAPLAVDAMASEPGPRPWLGTWTSMGLHYFSDNAVSSCALAAGWKIMPVHGYAFTHGWAQEGRKEMQGEQFHREQAAWAHLHSRLGLA